MTLPMKRQVKALHRAAVLLRRTWAHLVYRWVQWWQIFLPTKKVGMSDGKNLGTGQRKDSNTKMNCCDWSTWTQKHSARSCQHLECLNPLRKKNTPVIRPYRMQQSSPLKFHSK